MGFDHHCVWLGTCIGKRNYKYFMYFITLLLAYGIYVMIFCALSIIFRSIDLEDTSLGFGSRWYSVLIFGYTCIVNCCFNFYSSSSSSQFLLHITTKLSWWTNLQMKTWKEEKIVSILSLIKLQKANVKY